MPYADPKRKLARQKEYARENVEARRAYRQAFYQANKERVKAASEAYRKSNPEKVRVTRARSRAKLLANPALHAERKAYWREWHRQNRAVLLIKARTRRGFPAPTRACPKACECCGRPPSSKALALDHCHATRVFRGWLCEACNLGIGKLGDSLAALERAVAYLRRAETAS